MNVASAGPAECRRQRSRLQRDLPRSGAGDLRARKRGPDQFAVDRVENGGQHDRTPLFDRGNTSKGSFQTDFVGSLKWFHCTPEKTCRGTAWRDTRGPTLHFRSRDAAPNRAGVRQKGERANVGPFALPANRGDGACAVRRSWPSSSDDVERAASCEHFAVGANVAAAVAIGGELTTALGVRPFQ
jgi:hypothetical protein